MRWLYASCKPEQNLLFGYHVGDETRRRFLIPLWNVYSFFVTYANLDNWTARMAFCDPPLPLQAHAAAGSDGLWSGWTKRPLAVRAALDVYDAEKATQHLEALLDDVSNWYVRRSRRRFWKSEADADKNAAYATLYHVLVEFIKLLAPFIPFTTEAMYQNLVRQCGCNRLRASVHHCFYPQADAAALDQRLLDKDAAGHHHRQPGAVGPRRGRHQTAPAVGQSAGQRGHPAKRKHDLIELADVLQEEINVKEIEVVSEVGELVNYKLLPNNRALGPKLWQAVPAGAPGAAGSGSGRMCAQACTGGAVRLRWKLAGKRWT